MLLEASAFDGRMVTEETVTAWHRILRGYSAAQAVRAMRNHFETEDRKLMPVHIVQGVKKIRSELMGGYQGPGLALEAPEVDPDDVMKYLREGLALRARAGDGAPSNVRELERGIGRMPGFMRTREVTAMVVACTEETCRALVGRQCRTKKGETRAPHGVRVEALAAWKAAQESA